MPTCKLFTDSALDRAITWEWSAQASPTQVRLLWFCCLLRPECEYHGRLQYMKIRTTNETTRMHEDPTIDPGDLRKLGISQSPPCLWEGLTALKTLWGNGDSLYTPLATGFIRVDDVDRLLRHFDLQILFKLEEMLLPRSERLEEDDLALWIDILTVV